MSSVSLLREMKQFVCGELVPGCAHVFHARSGDEILEQVAVHARDDHGMPEVPPEVADRILERITETSG
jgi:predicted small metal-binding protein